MIKTRRRERIGFSTQLCSILLLLLRRIQVTHGFHVANANHVSRMLRVHRQGPSTSTSTSTSLAMGRWSPNDDLVGADRIKACVPYLLPLIDGDQFGKYIYYTRFPLLGEINDFFMGPLVHLQHKIPFFGVGIFILLTLGTRFNTDMNRNVRFNAQQAALLDVALIFPELIGQGFVDDPLPRYIAEPCSNFVWYGYMSIVLYCVYSNLTGKKPDQIPFLSPSAELMVGPF